MRETLVWPGRTAEDEATFDTSDVVAAYRRRRGARHAMLRAPHGASAADHSASPGGEDDDRSPGHGCPGC